MNLKQITIHHFNPEEVDRRVNKLAEEKDKLIIATQSYYADTEHIRVIFYKEVKP
jgi:hypothetical protein